jgi:hypothetical protein
LWKTEPARALESAGVAHLRPPSYSRGFSSLLWGLFLGVFIWLGSLSVGVTGATAFIVGAVCGAAIFLYVLAYGGDERRAQSARRERAR